MNNSRDRIYFGCFLASCVFLLAVIVFLLGMAVSHFRVWPYDALRAVYQHGKSFWTYGEWAPQNRIVPAPAGA